MTNEEMQEFLIYMAKVDEMTEIMGKDYGDDFNKYLDTIALFIATLMHQKYFKEKVFLNMPSRINRWLEKIIQIERIMHDKPSN